MILKKLEIAGFKSFAKRVELNFDSGITAVIGPNGSGKSNIADAVRWVLGEQSAKSLRGDKMEDIIFNGSDSAKAQAFCEVGLTFDNQSRFLPIEYAEVQIMRRVYRSGESEYFINRRDCRLKDIVELFRDTGIGKEGYCIIGQGKVDEILSNKSEDRRAAFEEAAGVTKYRSRRDEALKKLMKSEENLLRVDDIASELERQLEPLKIASEKAKKYLTLRDELRLMDINLFLRQYDNSNIKLIQQRETYEQLKGFCAAEQEKIKGFEQKIKDIAIKIEEYEKAGGEISQKLMELSSQSERSYGQLNLIAEKRENEEQKANSAKSRIIEYQNKNSTLEEELLKANENKINQGEGFKGQQSIMARLEAESIGVSKIVEGLESELDEKKNALMDAMNRISNAKVQFSKLEAMRASILARRQTISVEEDKIKEEIKQLSDEFSDAQMGEIAIKEQSQNYIELEKELEKDICAFAAKLNQITQTMREAENQFNQNSANHRLLSQMQKDYEGYYYSVKNLLRDVAKNSSLNGVIGVVARLIKAPKELEAALEAALGAEAQHIVTIDEQSAKAAIEHLRKNKYGRATFLPINAISPRALSDAEKRSINQRGCIGVASDLIKYDAKYSKIIENLLGRTVVVEDLDVGIRVARQNKFAFKLVTLKGDRINAGGSMSGGSTSNKENSLLGREREVAELHEKISLLKDIIEEKKREHEHAEKELSNLNEKKEQNQKQLHFNDITLMRQHEKLDTIAKLKAQYTSQITAFKNEDEQLNESLNDIETRLEHYSNQQQGLSQGQEICQKDISDMQKQVFAHRVKRDGIFESLTSAKILQTKLQSELNSLEEYIARINQQSSNNNEQIYEANIEIEQCAQKICEYESELGEKKLDVENSRNKINLLSSELEDINSKRERHKMSQQSFEQELKASSLVQKDFEERMHKAEMIGSKAEQEIESLQNRLWDDYELTYNHALELKLEDISMSNAASSVEELKKQMRLLGDVNLNSIDDYKIVKERYDSIYEQRQDLQKAKQDLEKLMDELTEQMRIRFSEKFELINQNFSGIFKQLFGGGNAQLRLNDKSDVLTSEIEIIAQPPGKKLTLLSLLSGGERALTAIAILFAMLKLRPAPFCLLDEIEASLDEANVDNFAAYIKNYSENTQFILISHRKGTMAVCDSLYGVAMEEKGVSRIVSVRLEGEAS